MEKRVIAKGDRLDKEITDKNLSRSQAAKLIVSGGVSVGGKKDINLRTKLLWEK